MSPATILVIFGASGDLTRRKLIPALFELHRKGRLPEGFRLLGAARSPATDDTFREQARLGLQTFAPESFDEAAWGPFAARLHYLGKETVQNVLVLRFANSIFEPIWNRNYIDHVQITAAEAVGIEHRGRFYDSVGVLRDVFQNHLLQLLTMVAMEPPASFDPEALRDERQKVLQSVRAISEADAASHTLRGQYEGRSEERRVGK